MLVGSVCLAKHKVMYVTFGNVHFDKNLVGFLFKSMIKYNSVMRTVASDAR